APGLREAGGLGTGSPDSPDQSVLVAPGMVQTPYRLRVASSGEPDQPARSEPLLLPRADQLRSGSSSSPHWPGRTQPVRLLGNHRRWGAPPVRAASPATARPSRLQPEAARDPRAAQGAPRVRGHPEVMRGWRPQGAPATWLQLCRPSGADTE